MRNIQRMNVFQQGLIWGMMLGVVDLILGLIGNFAHLGFVGILVVIIGLVTYLFVGLRAAQVTGRTGTGALVGLFTGLFSALISSIGTIITAFTNVDTLRQSAQSAADKLHLSIHYTNNMVILTTILGAVGAIVLALVLGTVIGAIGGAIGKGRASNKSVSEYSEISAR